MAIHTISVYVANKPGVLARIAQIFARRGFNIDSLVVSPSSDGRYSRMTIASQGSAEGLEQIILQVSKLVDVMHCMDHSTGDAIVREMALAKLRVTFEQRTEVLQICEHFGCKTVDLTPTAMTVMVTGPSEKLDACLAMLRQFELVELVRTGKVVMARGDEVT
ncbi:MAG: acetolactate synthase small subunit [Verrucomicrobia bacterium]|nr:acetolactate synthase small subunit [Verrucomicrobiota bacterium]